MSDVIDRLKQLAAVVGAQRCRAEIETTANPIHPHILRLFDSGEAYGYRGPVLRHCGGEP